MALATRTSAVSLLNTIRRQLRGFGHRNGGLTCLDKLYLALGSDMQVVKLLFRPLGAMLPLRPVSVRVSGRQRMIGAKQRPESMLRNRKIQCQFVLAARIPPMTGPRLGAMLGLEITSQYIVRPECASNDIHARIVQHRQTFLVRAVEQGQPLR